MEIEGLVLILLVVSLVIFSGCLYEARTSNPALCEKVSQQQNKDICYHEIALDRGSESLCEKIVDLNRRDRCYVDLAAGRNYLWED